MSEEEKEAIKIVNSLKEWGKIHFFVKDRSYARLTYNEVYLLLNLIEKQEKKIEELEKAFKQRMEYSRELEEDLFENSSNYVISKDKIK